MKLFLFHDGVEEILVAAEDSSDAFKVVEEEYGKDAADGLIMAKLNEYTDSVAQITNPNGVRGILRYGEPNTFTKLKFKDASN